MSLPPSQEDQVIDELLERYLGLMDEYAALRAALAGSHQRTLHALARARFTGDRGARFGPDQYDDRMRASRRVAVVGSQPASFSVVEEEAVEEEGGGTAAEGGAQDEEDAERKKRAAKNPLRWFGVLVPQALRDAQTEAVRTVEDVVPRLASVQAEMAHVEIEVRRARKRRAKAGKKQEATSNVGQAISTSS
ncbi:hypothetical protein ISF_01932 [Cordyceps fumosorosea ARSEF 2679]|uniref:Vacuolar ATPase assembly protein VMA22 n=1 Tax=Cordyceps fumosorosea (strain ARSEF 2679) TaxID=1081104 RepID=A0A168CHH3_CORFA|nr:hypothetical protein ISF_01932 [Cordyceps fumosorosea ARSEF 2679]OAA71381.1 hypothetical protein ISF_01932 [Cordyceps fumosorosea ARSEF 2679]